MTSRAQHIAEMRVALERHCSLTEAKAYLAATKVYAGEAALRKLRGQDHGRGKAQAPQPVQEPNLWWKKFDA